MSDLLTINEVATRLGVTKLTLRNWDKNGVLTAVRVGSRKDRRYRSEDVEALVTVAAAPAEVDAAGLAAHVKTHTFWTEEIPGLPIPLEMGVRKMVETGRYFQPTYTHCIFLYEHDYVRQYLSVEESIEICKAQMNALHEAPAKVNAFLADCTKQFAALEKTITRFNFLDTVALSNHDLDREFGDFQKALGAFWTVTLAVEPYSPFLEEYYLPRFEKEVGNRKLAREAFPALTLPSDLSFVSEERRDTLAMILRFLKSSRERRTLLESSDADYLAHLSADAPLFLAALRRHQESYFWTQNGYAGRHVLTVSQFLGFIRDIVRTQPLETLTAELQELESRKEFLAERERSLAAVHVSERTIREVEYLRKVVWIKDERKKFVLKMSHVVFGFLEEYARRTGLSVPLVAHAAIHEMPKLLNKELDASVLEQRRERLFFVSEHGDRASFITGNEAIVLKDALAHAHAHNPHDLIEGTIACRGGDDVVRGRVKVVLNPKDVVMREDEILVTSMTRPEFVSLMRKARAVVTDEGGITCHAAIVSREMNKPCIIGTKHATKVLKTGDMVEMRMNHGSVRVIEEGVS